MIYLINMYRRGNGGTLHPLMAPLGAIGAAAASPGRPHPVRGVLRPFSAGGASAPLRGGLGSSLHAADSVSGPLPKPLLEPVSAERSFSGGQTLRSDVPPTSVQDLLLLGSPQPDPQRAVAGGIDHRRISLSSSRSEKCSTPVLPEDPHSLLSALRIQAAESSDCDAVCSPCFQFTCVEDEALKSGSVRSRRRATDDSAAPRVSGMPLHSATGVNDGGWEVVRPRFWWRKALKNPVRSPRNLQLDVKGTNLFKLKLKGKCYNCLSPAHLAFCCSAPTRCWQCLQSGHKARYCNQKVSQRTFNAAQCFPEPAVLASKSSTYQEVLLKPDKLHKYQDLPHVNSLGHPPPSTKKSYLQAVLEDHGMEARYPGDPRVRPARAFCAVSATGSIRRRRDELIDTAVVCSFDGNSHEVDILSAGDMLREKFSLQHGQYQLVKHFPEQFFIIFSDPRSKQWALDRRSVSYRGRIFHFGDWSEDSYARKTNLEFRVKVRVEGISVHCWGEDVASKALGKSCAIHYVQERTRRRERTRSFDLWAWCSDPCDIPKEVLLTVLEPDRELPPISTPLALVGAQQDAPADLKAGHVYTLRNHIEVVEDLSFLRGRGSRGGPPNRKQRMEFIWSYGAPDSVGEKRERVEAVRGREIARRDWGHDDDDDGDFQRSRRCGNRRHRSLSGWARSSRCRGGMDDCYSSNDKQRHLTPFRRHGWESKLSSRWVPKVKVRSVSFADPIVTAVWPQEDKCGQAEDIGDRSGSMGAVILEPVRSPATTTCKLARHFSRPLTKEQMEAIMELATLGKEKEGIKKKGSKVTPLKAPIIEASEML
ncbi:uncharacterized protein [Zea mays]|uniref:uncharacterized protein isoform X3 n=1 Tax=Zea mays TaxID=4577 RepID=UPI0016529040|nr:uncharacterized protein LOC103640671 isoform X3 [Zea mays]